MQKVDSMKYEVTLNYYYDCDGNPGAFANDTPPTINYASSNCSQSGSITLKSIKGEDIAPVCPKNTSSCSGGNTKGIEKWIFRDTVTLSKNCTDWVFSWDEDARASAITTIQNPGTEDIYLESEVNNDSFPDNKIPYFTNDPVAFICNNQDYVYNHGAVDPDGDSLVYSLYTPKTLTAFTNNVTTVNYKSGYSAQQPLKSSPSVSIDSNTGNITMHPTKTDITVFGVKVEEYDTNGILKSKILRDIQVIVKGNCTSPNPPKLAGFDSTSDYDTANKNFDTTVCPGEKVELYLNANDSDANDTLKMTWNKTIKGANFTVLNDSTNSPTGKFTWTPPNPSNNSGIQRNAFSVTVQDNNCPYFTTISRGYNINVVPSKTVDLGDTAYVPCDDSIVLKPEISGGSADSNFGYIWSTGETKDSVWVADPGTYTVTVTDTGNCPITDTIEVLPSLNPSYQITSSFAADRGCVNDSVQFTDSSKSAKATVDDWDWHFGDGDTSDLQNPKHKYDDTGSFSVRLIISDTNDCQDTIDQKIGIDAKPNADFGYDLSCSRDTTHFFDSAKVSTGTLYSWEWKFGNGDTSDQANPELPYDTGGKYTVTQIVNTRGGCTDTLKQTVRIHPRPKADFEFENTCKDVTTHFYDSTSIEQEDSLTQWDWTFGDNTSSSDQNPGHTYSSTGTYTTKLITTSSNNCKDSVSKNLIINPPPTINTIDDTTFCEKDSVKLKTDVQSNTGEYLLDDDFDGGVQSSDWNSTNLGSSGTYCGSQNGSALYFDGDGGDRKAVTTDLDARKADSIEFYFKYGNQTNNAFSNSGCDEPEAGEEVNVDYSTDGGSSWTTIQTLSLSTYKNSNFTKVTLEVPDAAETDSTRFRWKQKTYDNCQSLIFFGSWCLDNWAMDEAKISNKDVYSYSWSPNKAINDSTKLSPKASPLSITDYKVSANDTQYNCTVYDTVTLKPQEINLAFSSNAPICENKTLNLSDNSTIKNGSFNSTEWDFGDGNTSTDVNPAHDYSDGSNYDIKLKKTSGIGCSDSLTKTDTIDYQPEPDFTFDTACLGDSTQFTDQTSIPKGNIQTWNWTFGSSGSANKTNPAYQFSSADSFQVTSVTTSNNGCKDTISKYVYVGANPDAGFTASENCETDTVTFNNKTSLGFGNVKQWDWKFGNDDSSNVKAPEYAYDSNGLYTVKLETTTNFLCKDSFKKTLPIHPYPNAGFNVGDTAQCFTGNGFSFTDKTTIDSGTLNYTWKFRDGQTSSATSPNHTYNSVDTYNVRQVVNSNEGCYDTARQTVITLSMPDPDFTINDSAQCFKGNFFQYTNKSNIRKGSLSYKWELGNNKTATAKDTTYVYNKADTFSVSLIATSNEGCEDTAERETITYPMPQSIFSVPDTNQCLSTNSFSFNNNSTIAYGNLKYKWRYGNGDSSSTKSPSYSYADTGLFEPHLTVTSDQGCTTSDSNKLIVQPMPKVRFTINNVSQCLMGNRYKFSNNSSIPPDDTITDYTWHLGNGETANSRDTSFKYQSADTFEVKLMATSSKGCKDSLEREAQVDPMPKADFTINDTSQCLDNNRFAFTNQTQVEWGKLVYQWEFKDGNSSALKDPVHGYQKPGDYEIFYEVTTLQGCKDTLKKSISVDPMPEAKFFATTVCKGNTTQFSDSSGVQSGSLKKWQWEFGDGKNDTGPVTGHKYDSAGDYNSSLIVTSDKGCQDTAGKTVHVGFIPKPAFKLNYPCSEDSVKFTNQSGIKADSIVAWHWDFENGDQSGKDNPRTLFRAGKYDVTLKATSQIGCQDSLEKSIKIHNKPIAGFKHQSICFGDTMAFMDTSKVTNGNIVKRIWRFGDGDSGTNANPSKYYNQPGHYKVQLEVQSNRGCWDTFSKRIYVGHIPKAGFRAQKRCHRQNTRFFDTSSLKTDSIRNWDWQFGNGNTGNREKPLNRYNNPGKYEVNLKVQSYQGCTDQTKDSVIIHPTPKGDFSVKGVCMGDSARFTNKTIIPATGKIDTQLWMFGDGDSSQSGEPTHYYDKAGKYDVSLLNTSQEGCTDTATQKLSIHPTPNAKIGVKDSHQCLNQNAFDFTNSSSIRSGKLTYQWYFGDMDSSGLKEPSHSYQKSGIYRVKMMAASQQGCTDTAFKQIKVDSQTLVRFSINDSSQCYRSNRFRFINQSQEPSGNMQYQWAFGDGQNANNDTAIHTYDTPGDYPVQLITTTDKGCRDTLTKSIKVNPHPEAAFQNTRTCVGDSTVFKDQSTIKRGSITQWQYDFGDNSSAAVPNPKNLYGSGGTYRVSLVATSNAGCSDTVTNPVLVYGKPEPPKFVKATVKADTHVYIEWEPPERGKPKSYLLERQINDKDFEPIAFLNRNTLSHRDTNLQVDQNTFTYRIKMRDSCGNISAYGDNVSTPVKLSVSGGEGNPLLQWTPYEGWEVSYYEIQRFNNEQERYQTVPGYSMVPGNKLKAIDSISEMDFTNHCYRIIAHKKGEPEITSVSNIDCFNPEMRVYVPNAFSPDGNGINDHFRPRGTYVLNFRMKIYNRWGQKVFESHSLKEGWDGTFEGEKVEAGSYLYIIFAEGPNGAVQKLQGRMTVIK